MLGKEREDAAAESEAAYRKAEDVSANLAPLHPLRLGLSLNHSVLYYEIFRDSVTASSIASKVSLKCIVYCVDCDFCEFSLCIYLLMLSSLS